MYDCVICGAGPSGLAAAISAKRQGLKVLLIEQSALLGGTNVLSLVGPLMTFHSNNKKVIGGIASDIIDRLITENGSLGHILDPLGFCSTVTPVDTEKLKQLYFDIIDEEKIDLLLHTKVFDCIKENNTIKSIKIINVSGISEIKAKVFIDATGNGDLAVKSGSQSIFGRIEDNLCQPMTMPFIVNNVDLDKLKESMKNNKNNFVIRDDYDYKYVGISGFFAEVDLAKANNEFNINRDRVLLFENVRKNSVTINMSRVLKLSAIDGVELTKAEIEGRKQIKIVFNFLKKYIPGFENSYVDVTPYQIGIRESRHIICDYMMQKEDIINNKCFDDSITIGAFPMDIHSPVGDKLEVDENIGCNCYEIPMRSLFPVGIDNLIVTGRIIGASHEAAASIRVTPCVMALGEAAGIIASCAINNQNVRKVNYNEVFNKLKLSNCIIKKNML